MKTSRWCWTSLLTWVVAGVPGCSSSPNDAAPSGTGDGGERIAATRDLSIVLGPTGPLGPITTSSGIGDAGGTYTCTTQAWGESEVRDLTDSIALDPGSALYPGAIVQGRNLEEGQFTPVTIPRAGGAIYLQGLRLAPNAQYGRTLDMVSGQAVQQAVQDILSVNVTGTAASASFVVEATYGAKHMLFRLGVDGRFGVASMSGDLNIDSLKEKNYVFLKFTQKYFDILFEDPTSSTSVFRDGEGFADPEGQIIPDNPPLYVSKVSYGRMVFFVAESEADALDVEAALRGAYEEKDASLTVASGLTYRDVMKRTKVYYYVIGGSAGLALQPIAAATPDAMYDAVRGFLADKEAGSYSATNPGAPIAYTLRYLKNRQVARTSYAVTYDKKNCTFRYPPAVWSTTGSGVLHTEDTTFDAAGSYKSGDRITYVVEHGVAAPDAIEFVLQLGSMLTWEKRLQVTRANDGTSEEIAVLNDIKTAATALYTIEVGQLSRIYLKKEKGFPFGVVSRRLRFGAADPLRESLADLEYLRGGDRVSFLWEND